MKKIVAIICAFMALECALAQSSNSSTSSESLKAKIVKLESQIKDDVEIIRALRSENRALKRELRKIKGGKTRVSDSSGVDNVKRQKTVKAQERVESVDSVREESTKETRGKDSSVWDNMFPF